MSARIIDGKAAAEAIRSELADEVERLVGAGSRRPGLATILVGDDPASAVYVANKKRACDEVGFAGFHVELPSGSSQSDVGDAIVALNANTEVDGILLQLPVPAGLDSAALIRLISPAKDVDGLTPASVAALALGQEGLRPCTPSGVIELLDREGIEIAGSHAVVVGRSDLVGRPLVSLLLERDATVTICHSRTPDLASACRAGDIVVAAAGRPGLIGPDCISDGAAVIDVGINRLDGGLVGDVDFDAVLGRAGWITPVPGGVGPMTIAMLLRNTLEASRRAGSA